ncbi:hypothetical protein AAP_02200 [Ascosphaera apis ARSEF 7405]|uniref:Uncharacterized protein n=1 Tax=Ascosphaera apis ARSEF 7405 TaxID=392613 RepID=A0A168AMJ2_9EURO|nr:hypothetical protein AAP_02200 [Ascosphaera apis ARSEF 7405]
MAYHVLYGNVKDAGLESIGSVRQNFSSTSDQDDLKELYLSTQDASTIEYLYGESVCNEYVDDILRSGQQTSRKAASDASSAVAVDGAQASPRNKLLRFLRRLKKAYVEHYKDASHLHP